MARCIMVECPVCKEAVSELFYIAYEGRYMCRECASVWDDNNSVDNNNGGNDEDKRND